MGVHHGNIVIVNASRCVRAVNASRCARVCKRYTVDSLTSVCILEHHVRNLKELLRYRHVLIRGQGLQNARQETGAGHLCQKISFIISASQSPHVNSSCQVVDLSLTWNSCALGLVM